MEWDFGVGKYIGLWAFGVAFGYIEAAVVIYLRSVLGLESSGLFPISGASLGPESLLMTVEVQREAATLVLMAVPAFLASHRNVYRILSFLLIFGVWDLSYYGFLWLQLGWPVSLFSYDILFLIPTLWISPVLCPILISLSMVGYATLLMPFARRRRMPVPSWIHWLLIASGTALVLFSFIENAEYYRQGGLPPQYSWPVFSAGYALAAAVALHYLYLTLRRPRGRFR